MLWERVILLLGILAIFYIGSMVWRRYLAGRAERLAQIEAPPELQRLIPAGQPALLYFTTQDCVQCRLQQSPILERLSIRFGIPVYRVDAVENENLAGFYGIMTVPTTVFLDARLRPVAINHGVTTFQRLQQQFWQVTS